MIVSVLRVFMLHKVGEGTKPHVIPLTYVSEPGSPVVRPRAYGVVPSGVGCDRGARLGSISVMSSSAPTPAPRAWIVWSLRLTATFHLVGVLAQAALAGLFVTGDVDLLAWHRDNAGYTHSMLYAQLVAAVLLWRPGRGAWWPAAASLGLVVVETVQVALGQWRVLEGHFPLGMAIFGLSAVFTVWTWLAFRRPRNSAEAEGTA